MKTKVGLQVKKLSGEVMYKLILFSMLITDKLSLSAIKILLRSISIKAFSYFDILDNRYNSIRDCRSTIMSEYF